MKTRRMTCAGAALALLFAAGCKDSPNHLGVIHGDVTGVAFRHKLDRDNAAHADLAVHGDVDFIHGHVDYQFYPHRIRQNEWNFYWGLGVSYSADVSDDADPDLVGLGFRVPLGLAYEFDDESGDFFAQAAPFLVNDQLVFSWAIGVRFGI